MLDVTTRRLRAKYGITSGMPLKLDSGDRDRTWRWKRDLVSRKKKIYADQHIVADVDRMMTVYRNGFQDDDPAMITAELEAGGFAIERLWGDLGGAPLTEDSERIGGVTRRI